MNLECVAIARAVLGQPVARSGRELLWPCPNHHDDHPSLSINYEKNVWICGPCGASGEAWKLAAFLAKVDPSDKPAVTAWLRGHNLHSSERNRAITVEDLARDKKLPADFLRSLGVEDSAKGVRITYRLMDGSPAPRQRIRTALIAKEGSRWSKGRGEVVPYGLWRLDKARETGYLVIVEGESDAWTLWLHEYPCIGLPGAEMARKLQAEYFEKFQRVYIVREPDESGAKFAATVGAPLGDIGWLGESYAVRLPEAKDPNDLYRRDPNAFKRLFTDALEKSERLPKSNNREKPVGAPSTPKSVRILGSEATGWSAARSFCLIRSGTSRARTRSATRGHWPGKAGAESTRKRKAGPQIDCGKAQDRLWP